MKVKEKEAKKNLSADELASELHTAQEKHFKLQFKHQVTRLDNPLELRKLRRDIARLKTWLGEKRAASQEK